MNKLNSENERLLDKIRSLNLELGRLTNERVDLESQVSSLVKDRDSSKVDERWREENAQMQIQGEQENWSRQMQQLQSRLDSEIDARKRLAADSAAIHSKLTDLEFCQQAVGELRATLDVKQGELDI
jgi:phage I-like protein